MEATSIRDQIDWILEDNRFHIVKLANWSTTISLRACWTLFLNWTVVQAKVRKLYRSDRQALKRADRHCTFELRLLDDLWSLGWSLSEFSSGTHGPAQAASLLRPS